MSEYKSGLLRARKAIVDNVTNVDPLVDCLVAALNDDERESIFALSNRKAQTRKLLDILSYRPALIPRFYSALLNAEYFDAATALEHELPELQQLRASNLEQPPDDSNQNQVLFPIYQHAVYESPPNSAPQHHEANDEFLCSDGIAPNENTVIQSDNSELDAGQRTADSNLIIGGASSQNTSAGTESGAHEQNKILRPNCKWITLITASLAILMAIFMSPKIFTNNINTPDIDTVINRDSYSKSKIATDSQADRSLLLKAYNNAFVALRLQIEFYQVGNNLSKLKENGVIDKNLLTRLVSVNDPNQQKSIFYNHLMTENSVKIYENFITVCDETDIELAKSIKTVLEEERNKIGV